MPRLTRRNENGKILFTTYKNRNDIERIECCEDGQAALNKLAEYEDLEEQGLMVKLPCKVGDTIYINSYNEEDIYRKPRKQTYGFEVIQISFNKHGKWFVYGDSRVFSINDKKIFFTEEEATKALEGKDD